MPCGHTGATATDGDPTTTMKRKRDVTDTFLDRLLADSRARVAADRSAQPLEAMIERARAAPPPPSFAVALRASGVSVIAEIKRASPSRGELAPDLDAAAQARAYRAGGAACISVLTEPDLFHGSLDDLAAVAALGTPTLRKDFTVDAYQIWQARAHGAAAVLLIVAALTDGELAGLAGVAREAGLDALVEIHDEAELARAVAIDAAIIGVNARDLRSFEVDRGAFARLRGAIPDGVVAIAESGVRGPDDVRAAADLGADAVLVGESLVTAEDPEAAVTALVAAGRPTESVR